MQLRVSPFNPLVQSRPSKKLSGASGRRRPPRRAPTIYLTRLSTFLFRPVQNPKIFSAPRRATMSVPSGASGAHSTRKFHAAAFRRGSSRRGTPRGIFQKRRARRGPESRPRGLQPHSARLRHPAPLRRSGPVDVPQRRYLPEFLFEITSNTESGRE